MAVVEPAATVPAEPPAEGLSLTHSFTHSSIQTFNHAVTKSVIHALSLPVSQSAEGDAAGCEPHKCVVEDVFFNRRVPGQRGRAGRVRERAAVWAHQCVASPGNLPLLLH